MVEEAEERAERKGVGSCVKEEEEAGTGGRFHACGFIFKPLLPFFFV